MKIVQICPYAMARPGGVQRNVRDLSAWLTANGHETRIVAPPAPGHAAQVQGPLTEIGRARALAIHGTAFEISFAAPWAVRRLARDLRDWGAELVHLHTPWTPLLAGQMHRALRLPTVTTIHATLPRADGADLVDRYIRRSAARYIQRSAAIVTPSQAPVPMLQSLAPGLRPTILPPCVDLSRFKPRDKRRKSCLFLGRFEPRKGLDILLQAWPQIQAAHPDAHLTVAGSGPLADHLPDGITHHPSPSDAEVRHLMGAAEMFFAPAPYGESYGLVLAEAMAAGAVPLAAANPGYAHVLRSRPEQLVPPGDADALAQRAISLLSQDLSDTRRDAEQLAQQSDVRTCGPAYAKLYQQALARWYP